MRRPYISLRCADINILKEVPNSSCASGKQLNTPRPTETEPDEWATNEVLKFFRRRENWPVGEQDWLEVIYVPDIFNQITQHPLQFDYHDAVLRCACVRARVISLSQGNSSGRTRSTGGQIRSGVQTYVSGTKCAVFWDVALLYLTVFAFLVYWPLTFGWHLENAFRRFIDLNQLIDLQSRLVSGHSEDFGFPAFGKQFIVKHYFL